MQLGGKTYLTDGACAIVTYGLAYNKDNEKPYNMDLKNRLFEYHGYMYYVQDDYSLLTDGYNGYLYFGKDGRYTSGDAELDAYVWDIIKDFVDNNNLTRVQKLLKAYYVLRGGEGSNYVDNGFFYVRKGTMLTADRYNLQKQNSLLISCAKQMFSVKYGLCYQWGAAYHFIITRLGFQSYVVVGTVGNPGNTGTAHCWNIVKWDGDWYLSDVELEWGWLAGKKGNGQKLYWNLFDQKLSGEWVKSYTNSETNLKYTFPY